MTSATVTLDIHGKIGILRLNRPHRMNAVNRRLYEDLAHHLKEATQAPSLRALILTGNPLIRNGIKKEAFCAGADLKEHDQKKRTPEEKQAYIQTAHATCLMLRTLPLPVIAAVNGPARGAGAEMALNCDFIIMAHKASLGFPETGLGSMVGGGVTRHLERTVGLPSARELIYTGRVLTGPESVTRGLALSSVPLEDLMDTALNLAQCLIAKAPRSLAWAKALIENAPQRPLADVYDDETEAIVSCMATRDWQEGIDAFKKNRQPVFKGE